MDSKRAIFKVFCITKLIISNLYRLILFRGMALRVHLVAKISNIFCFLNIVVFFLI